ncbi:N-acetyltransferase [Elioraea sp.]|uniref:GNAT family N-acetyltransferase n=1 Tax=Elioraea sp. TaxID=2185103 RepID=UPI0021DB90E6|nr:GNAT family N-acetyltransferase [Elioraea sp.]GIX11034.1 MAG: N-acetyltransferase [Elioraea sp.]
MALAPGYHDVPAGHVPAVVTHLEMTARPPPRPLSGAWPLRLVERPEPAWYRDLYRRIGTQHLWAMRLRWSDEAMRDRLHDAAVEIWALRVGETDEGLAELDFATEGSCEIRLFGVTAGLHGTGAARSLMTHALERAWSRPGLRRVWLHTCSLDHPRALGFYLRSGFVPFRYQIEIMPDPRLDGTLPEDAAPGVPIIRARP